MIQFNDFFEAINLTALKRHIPFFKDKLDECYFNNIHGDYAKWQQALEQLPNITPTTITLDSSAVSVGHGATLTSPEKNALINALKALHPWRKGPFNIFGIDIDTEWRSDWKWDRIKPHISPLKDRYVLDVGCGSGYHCWRMSGAGAKLVIGIDPSQKFLMQFHALKKYIHQQNIFFLPLKSEDMPKNMQGFDTTFSMGVLYHRASPFDHLDELRQSLKPGGELVLETLTVEGPENTVIVPNDRYAKMRNVWFLPSPDTLCQWLQRAGFINIKLVDVNQTSLEEQRSTEWMTFHSLEDFLDPSDINRTIEGLPAPVRTTVIAEKPGTRKPSNKPIQ